MHAQEDAKHEEATLQCIARRRLVPRRVHHHDNHIRDEYTLGRTTDVNYNFWYGWWHLQWDQQWAGRAAHRVAWNVKLYNTIIVFEDHGRLAASIANIHRPLADIDRDLWVQRFFIPDFSWSINSPPSFLLSPCLHHSRRFQTVPSKSTEEHLPESHRRRARRFDLVPRKPPHWPSEATSRHQHHK